jgi:signal transduction histidine kinase
LCNKEAILVNADRERPNQIISNLLSNALKFTKEGIIFISEHKRIESKGDLQEEEAIVMANNTGSGIELKLSLFLLVVCLGFHF